MARELCLPSFHVETQSGVRSLVLRGVAYRTNFVDSGPFAASRDAATLFFFFFWVDDARRVSFGAGSVFQRRHFLGCGDGEEGGGELSKIYQERRLLGIEICLCVFMPNNYELVFQKDDNLTDTFVLVRLVLD
ncbi:hypothetical protein Bca101_091894 [Brassica carinata]